MKRSWCLTVFVVVVGFACNKPSKPAASGPSQAFAPALEIRDKPGFLFTYLDESGQQHQTEKRSDIPEKQRDSVRVIDLSLPPDARGAGRVVYLADLREPRADGTFAYRMLSTVSFEQALVAKSAQGKIDEALQASPNQVTIYTASWCGVCARAKSFMQQRGVAFVERDVEGDDTAQAELREKVKRAGVVAKGVPVIDVYGELLLGFDEQALMAAIARRRG